MWEQDGGRGVIGIPISLYTSLIRVKGGGGFLANSSKASSKAGLKSIEWLEPRSGRFSIKDFYYLLVPSGSKIFLTRVISNSWIPIRVGFIAYEATWGRRLALDLSKRKKVSLLNKSYKCKKEEESINHMFLHCSTTGILQQLVFSSFKLKWVIHSSIKPMLQSWNGSYVGRRKKVEESLVAYHFDPFLDHFAWQNGGAFDNVEILEQLLKSSFMHHFFKGVKTSLGWVFYVYDKFRSFFKGKLAWRNCCTLLLPLFLLVAFSTLHVYFSVP